MGKKELFLKELSELSRKYQMYIGGCGCCSSPYVTDENDEDVLKEITYDYDEKIYKEEE